MAIPEEKLVELKEALLADKKRLEDKIVALKDMDFGSSPGLNNEEADEAEERSNTLATIETFETRLEGISVALKKFEMDSYGKCEKCNGDMSLALLEANPESSTCKECK